jgi:carbon monoxide dehydrogenase subunit G
MGTTPLLMSRLPAATLLSLLLLVPALSRPTYAAQSDDGLDISISVDGDEVRLDISALIEAKPREVWAVFTDFDRMAEFVSNLKSSQVIARNSPTAFTVEQHGRAGAGPLSFTLDSVREIQMKPFEWIRSKLLSGGMKRFDGITRLSEEGGKTRVTYHSDAVSGVWIPPVIGRKLIEDEAREQFTQMMQEVIRRKQTTAANTR